MHPKFRFPNIETSLTLVSQNANCELVKPILSDCGNPIFEVALTSQQDAALRLGTELVKDQYISPTTTHQLQLNTDRPIDRRLVELISEHPEAPFFSHLRSKARAQLKELGRNTKQRIKCELGRTCKPWSTISKSDKLNFLIIGDGALLALAAERTIENNPKAHHSFVSIVPGTPFVIQLSGKSLYKITEGETFVL